MQNILSYIFTAIIKASIYINDIFNLVINVLQKLDGEVRINIYIGITGILIAVVVFIAESIKENGTRLYKKMVLSKTKIVENVKILLIIMAIIWFGEIIDINECNFITYIIMQILINFLVIYSMIITINMFVEVIKLKIDEKYFYNELKKFVFHQTDKIEIKNKESLLGEKDKNNKLEKFIKKSKIFEMIEKNNIETDNNFKALNANKNGYILDYDIQILQLIENEIKPMAKKIYNFNDIDLLDIKLPKIYLCNKIGERCTKEYPIVYYKNVDDKIIRKIYQAIIIKNEEQSNYDLETTKMIDDIFSASCENIVDFDNYNLLVDYYHYIIDKKYEYIMMKYINKILKYAREFNNNLNSNSVFSELLEKIASAALLKNRYEDFKQINNCITMLFISRLKMVKNDSKLIYDYANNIFNIHCFIIKSNSNLEFYDSVLSNLLIIIKQLIMKENLDALIVLMENINFGYNYSKNNNIYNEFKFLFSVGLVCVILYGYEKREEKDLKKYIEQVKIIINVWKRKNFDYNNMQYIWNTIIEFKKIMKRDSAIIFMIDTMDIDDEINQYKNVYSLNSIDKGEILKNYIYMFCINYIDPKEIDQRDIDIEDKYFFKRLLKTFEKENYSKLEKSFNNIESIKSNIEKLLTCAIGIAESKECNYEIDTKLDEEKKEEFKKTVQLYSTEESLIEKKINKLGGIVVSDEISNNILGINTLIQRKLFFENTTYTKEIAKEYGKSFKNIIEREIILKIKSKSEISKYNLYEKLNKIEKLDNYILIVGINKLTLLDGYDFENNSLKINNKIIEVIPTLYVEDFIIISKKSLPKIRKCKCNILNRKNKVSIIDNMYIELIDCSKDENKDIRDKILKNELNLQNKNLYKSDENYLKRMCLFRAFYAIEIDDDINEAYYIKDK